jgi:hypothetical protein
MKNQLTIVSLLIAILFIGSCATILKGTEQTITINSNIDDAEIFLDGVKIGETPFVGMVKKNKNALRVEKEGYKDYSLSLSKTLEPVFWANIISGGTLGSITDFATGAAYAYAPASYQVELYKEGETEAAFLQRLELRKYAMINITDISVDLGNSGGNYLRTLIELAELDYSKSNIELIKAKFDETKGNEVLFGNEIVALIQA